MQRLFVSVRGPREALEAARGGAHGVSIEYPASELGTPYPLNILSVRAALNKASCSSIPAAVSTGRKQYDRTSACQAALGIAAAGADIIKFGLAELSLEAAAYVGGTLVRTLRKFFPDKKIIPSVFVDDYLQRFFKPFREGADLLRLTGADGIHVDTYNKLLGKGLLDYASLEDISSLVTACHAMNREVWIAGSIGVQDMPHLWPAGVDVIAVRRAACEEKGYGRFGSVKEYLVRRLAATVPAREPERVGTT